MEIDYAQIGKRIAKRRRELGLKQRQVNEMTNLSDKYLSNIERASSIMSIDVLLRLCGALDITPNEILLGNNSQKEEDDDEEKAEIINILSSLSPRQTDYALNFLKWLSTQHFE